MRNLLFVALLSVVLACSPLHFFNQLPSNTHQTKDSQAGYRGSYYIVAKGDTLEYIAYITDKSVDDIVKANNLVNPDRIYPNQKLNLWHSKYVAPVYGRKPTAFQPQPKPAAPPMRLVKQNNKLNWQWPTQGRVITEFSDTDSGNKGIDIQGTKGQAILASAEGKVVYAGSALRGYGNLIIIKHDKDYLSAYAHNDSLLVVENQSVTRGQRIATMGNTGTDSVRLHFEIRYRGKSVNPNQYLPKI